MYMEYEPTWALFQGLEHPHQSDKQDPDLDTHQGDADPQPLVRS